MTYVLLLKLDARHGDKSIRTWIVRIGTRLTFSITYGNEMEISESEIKKGCPHTKDNLYNFSALFWKIVTQNNIDQEKASKLIGEVGNIWDQIKEIEGSVEKLQRFLDRTPVLAAPQPPPLP
jgi:hypothetical protein